MRNPRSLRSAVLLPAVLIPAALLSSCASTVGFFAGPVTGPITVAKHTRGIPTWGKFIAYPFAVGFGPLLGFVQGVRCDLGFLRNGGYGVNDYPKFNLVFDPASSERDLEWGTRLAEKSRKSREAR